MPEEKQPSVDRIAKWSSYGSLTASGGSVILLVTALRLLEQHGVELIEVRKENVAMRNVIVELRREIEKDIVEHAGLHQTGFGKYEQLENRLSDVERVMHDPRARPDSWTRSDDSARMTEYDASIKGWVERNYTRRANQ